MALTRQQTVMTYASASGSQTYLFDVVVDAQGLISVRNIRSPLGLIIDSLTSIPDSVLADMNDAKGITSVRMSESTADSGTIVFTGESSKAVAIASGVLNNTNYRVAYTTSDGMIIRTTDQTITGFTADVGAAYGSVAVPKTVSYTVLVATMQASVFSGTVTFVPADAGSKTVTFPVAQASTSYRVVTTVNGFFDVRVSSQLKTGFTLQLGYTIPTGGTAVVGYDVFI